jgi:pyrroloquinoline quinone biosynthesis protein D
MTVPAKDPSRFVETEVEEETVVMRLDSGDFFSLRGPARDIWHLIDGARGRDAILAELGEAYDAPPARLATDLDTFLADLRDAGLLHES